MRGFCPNSSNKGFFEGFYLDATINTVKKALTLKESGLMREPFSNGRETHKKPELIDE